MSRWRSFLIAVPVIALVFFFTIGQGMFWLPAIGTYAGDGTFQDLSRFVGPFGIPGYCVTMPDFDLGESFEAEYQLKGLTNIGRQCGVHLAIRDHDNGLGLDTNRVGGKLDLELLDSKERHIVNVSGRLGDYTWWGFRDLHVLYQSDRSYFRPESAETYRLRLKYVPDAPLAGYKGFVYVRSGGDK